jgi:hypothetical protein
MVTEPELECFTARLWDNQVKMNLSDEELYFSESESQAPEAQLTWFASRWVGFRRGDGHQLHHPALVCDGDGTVSRDDEEGSRRD